MSKTWKSRETKVARLFGSTRTPLSGRNSKHTSSDTLHSSLFVEQKHRKSHPIVKCWDEIHEADGIPSIVVLSERESEEEIRWVMFRTTEIDEILEYLPENIDGLDDILHSGAHINLVERKRFAVINLWKKTSELAKKESKLPVVSLSEKYRPGFWLVVRLDDLTELLSGYQEA